MEIVNAYKSKDGTIYLSEQECIEADRKIDAATDNQRFMRQLNSLLNLILTDCCWHKLQLPFNDAYFIKKKTRLKSTSFTIAVTPQDSYTQNHLTFVNSNYEENQVGFCHDTLRGNLKPVFWDKKDVWLKSLLSLVDEQTAEILNAEKQLKTKQKNIERASDMINNLINTVNQRGM